jgi:hypothetical protein
MFAVLDSTAFAYTCCHIDEAQMSHQIMMRENLFPKVASMPFGSQSWTFDMRETCQGISEMTWSPAQRHSDHSQEW